MHQGHYFSERLAIKGPPQRANKGAIETFLSQSKALRQRVAGQKRLLFAMDATASREPTWAVACTLHDAMFEAIVGEKHLAVQLCYYRGMADFYRSRWLSHAQALRDTMAQVRCHAGGTQISRVLRHALSAASDNNPLRAVIFIGDAVEEAIPQLESLAGQCRLKRLPLFIFQEGQDLRAQQCFKRLAALSGGAYARFDHTSPDRLRNLLSAVVRYVSGGRQALAQASGEGDKLLLKQLPGNPQCQE